MPYHFFSIRANDPTAAQSELNAFLAAHRVVAVRWRWIDASDDSRWVARVEVAAGGGPLPAAVKSEHGASGKAQKRVDYREILSAEEFSRFAPLRQWRNGLAAQLGIQSFIMSASPRRPRRLLEQHRQEGSLCLPERQRPGQPQEQPGLSAPPELPETMSRSSAASQGPDLRPVCGERRLRAPRRTARPLGVLVGAVDTARRLPEGPLFALPAGRTR